LHGVLKKKKKKIALAYLGELGSGKRRGGGCGDASGKKKRGWDATAFVEGTSRMKKSRGKAALLKEKRGETVRPRKGKRRSVCLEKQDPHAAPRRRGEYSSAWALEKSPFGSRKGLGYFPCDDPFSP